MVATKEGGDESGGNGNGGGSSSGVNGDDGGDPIQPECCMCGDYGITKMLFKCKVCKYRLQHKYCCNVYPKDEVFEACNWCMASTSTNTRSTNKNTPVKDHHDDTMKNKKKPDHKTTKISLRERRKASEIKVKKTARVNKMMASSSPNESPRSSTDRKKGVLVTKKVLRKTKSANYLSCGNGGEVETDGIKTKPPVFRTRVKKYRSLVEIISQCSR